LERALQDGEVDANSEAKVRARQALEQALRPKNTNRGLLPLSGPGHAYAMSSPMYRRALERLPRRSMSAPGLKPNESVSTSSSTSTPGGVLLSKPPYLKPKVHQSGHPVPPLSEAKPKKTWDGFHTQVPVQNDQKPKPLRAYFSAPQSLQELKVTLAERKHMTGALKNLDRQELPSTWPTKRTAITPDARAPICGGRHTFGGDMPDREGLVRPWNNRWTNSVALVNENLHPSHRQYFSQKSLYETSPSQRWRRFLDFEVDTGVWHPIDSKPPRFGPMGV
jgi:hypothetical protein